MDTRHDLPRSSHFLVRSYLEQGQWDRYQLGRQQLICCRVPWRQAIDPFALLDTPLPQYRFFWQAKDSQDIVVGVGAVLSSSELDSQLVSRVNRQHWFVATPFTAPQMPAMVGMESGIAAWSDLATGFLVLPRVEWSLGEDDQTLTIRALVDRDATALDQQRAIQHVLRDYLPVTLGCGVFELPELVGEARNVPDRDHWHSMVATAKGLIRDKHLAKVVLSRTKRLEVDRQVDMAPLMRALSEMAERSYLFGVRSPAGHGFLGRSPERLLAWDESSYYVDALAGTRRRTGEKRDDFDEATALRSSAKDLAEHRYVTDYIQSTLANYATYVEHSERETLLRLQHVQHIRSRFRAVRDRQHHPFACLQALHPTPAVGGLPKAAAVDFIEAHEGFNRGLFAGAFGLVKGDEYGEVALGIRTALVADRTLTLFAGAGIVEESDPEQEWQETEVKMKNFLDFFAEPARHEAPDFLPR
jgi:menaquinone-specific isochorismate synthase